MQKTFYMEAIIKGNKLGHKMLTGMKEMKYTRSSFTHACMCMLTTETGGCVRHSPQKCKHILLTARASQHSALQIRWEVSGDINATAFLSDLCLQPDHTILRLAHQLSDCSSRYAASYPQKHKSMYPWGILFQPRESLLPKRVSIIPFRSLSEKCNTVPLGFKMLSELCCVWGRFTNNSCCTVNHSRRTQPMKSHAYPCILCRRKRNADMEGQCGVVSTEVFCLRLCVYVSHL